MLRFFAWILTINRNAMVLIFSLRFNVYDRNTSILVLIIGIMRLCLYVASSILLNIQTLCCIWLEQLQIISISTKFCIFFSKCTFIWCIFFYVMINNRFSSLWPGEPIRPEILVTIDSGNGSFHAKPLHYSDIIMSAMVSQIIGFSVVCSAAYSYADQRKHPRSAALAFVRGLHRWPEDSPHKGSVTRKMFPFDDVFMPKAKLTNFRFERLEEILLYIFLIKTQHASREDLFVVA